MKFWAAKVRWGVVGNSPPTGANRVNRVKANEKSPHLLYIALFLMNYDPVSYPSMVMVAIILKYLYPLLLFSLHSSVVNTCYCEDEESWTVSSCTVTNKQGYKF